MKGTILLGYTLAGLWLLLFGLLGVPPFMPVFKGYMVLGSLLVLGSVAAVLWAARPLAAARRTWPRWGLALCPVAVLAVEVATRHPSQWYDVLLLLCVMSAVDPLGLFPRGLRVTHGVLAVVRLLVVLLVQAFNSLSELDVALLQLIHAFAGLFLPPWLLLLLVGCFVLWLLWHGDVLLLRWHRSRLVWEQAFRRWGWLAESAPAPPDDRAGARQATPEEIERLRRRGQP